VSGDFTETFGFFIKVYDENSPPPKGGILFLHKKYRFVFRFIIITANLRNKYNLFIFIGL